MRDWRHHKPGREIIREHRETVPREILDRIAVLERERVERERAMQEIVAIVDALIIRVQKIEVNAIGALSDWAEKKMKEA